MIGPRRSGKTFFMYQITESLEAEFGKENMVYVDFEDPLVRVSYSDFIRVLDELIPDRDVLLLDEIQSIEDWASWLRGFHNWRKYHIFVSGSSSKLLDREIVTSLRGRSISRIVFPFSFREIFKYEDLSGRKANALLNRYLEWGGFPRVYLSTDKSELLSAYNDTIFFRDVVERFNVRDIQSARIFRDQLMRNLAQPFSISKTTKFLKSIGISKSKKTLSELLDYFEDAFLIFSVPRFSRSSRGVTQMPKKVYPVDVGLFQPYFSFSESITRRFEAVAAIELHKESLRHGTELFYWQSHEGYEVDFVIRGRRGIEQMIQVCYNIEDEKTRMREERSLLKASRAFDCKRLLVITWDVEDKVEHDGAIINYIPMSKWLLGHANSDH
ncbi:MAG: ATP-binding protein [Candidatus Thorarchaeota archaeon]|nr:ATP-binding protein [Candidatus Thorarchaeota archaeon]